MKIIRPYIRKATNLWGKSFLLALLLLLINVSCASYQLHETGSMGMEPLPVDQSKTVVLHQGNSFVKLKSFELRQSELVGFPAGQLQSDGEPVEKTTSDRVAREAHLYLNESPPLVVEPGRPINVPYSSINKVMVYDEEQDKLKWWQVVVAGLAYFVEGVIMTAFEF